MRNYHAGDLAAAKQDFDNAVDTMLSSGLDLKNSPALSDEFEHIVDAVNTLEMDALKQGNGFAPPMEQTPVGVANDVTFPVDPNIRAAAEAELKTTQSDLPLVINDAVTSYIGYFSNTSTGRNTIISSLRRAGRYKDLIERTLREEGVPADLIYQAVAESGFQIQALNARTGAAGHVAVHALPWRVWSGAQWVGGRAFRSGESYTRLRPRDQEELSTVWRLVPGHGWL